MAKVLLHDAMMDVKRIDAAYWSDINWRPVDMTSTGLKVILAYMNDAAQIALRAARLTPVVAVGLHANETKLRNLLCKKMNRKSRSG